MPIVSLIAFLTGLILAFQAAGGHGSQPVATLVANLVGISLLRELGPLMMAILLAGRSGAAFAAEIGTMRQRGSRRAGHHGTRPDTLPGDSATARHLADGSTAHTVCQYGRDCLAAPPSCFRSIPFAAYMRETFAFADFVHLLGGMAKTFVFGAHRRRRRSARICRLPGARGVGLTPPVPWSRRWC
ncbi:MAG: ABC transporter permease [Burkholderiales bacterium]|nr:ABC transporter permease [Burkholderiales bacterium]